jgi:glycerol uptake facilitator-like aquaporin
VNANAERELGHFSLPRQLAAEGLGAAFLAATVIGSGIMAERLTGDQALALLCNTIPTGAVLVVLIAILAPISGAHLNPAVTLAFALRRTIAPRIGLAFVVAQIAGGLIGTMAAHVMFSLPLLDASETSRTGLPQWSAEVVATFGLVTVILFGLRSRSDAIPWLVGLYIAAAYWFTSSTAFANPALAIARAFTDTFTGIRPADLSGFILAELAGSIAAVCLFGWMFEFNKPTRR